MIKASRRLIVGALAVALATCALSFWLGQLAARHKIDRAVRLTAQATSAEWNDCARAVASRGVNGNDALTDVGQWLRDVSQR